MPTTHAEGFRRVCTERRYAWLTAGMFRYSREFAEQVRCDIVVLPQPFRKDVIAAAITKGNPYRRVLDHQ
jgi:hypothetical protein